jgi:hypothetical protein
MMSNSSTSGLGSIIVPMAQHRGADYVSGLDVGGRSRVGVPLHGRGLGASGGMDLYAHRPRHKLQGGCQVE